MSTSRLQSLLDRWGSDPARWPQPQRAEFDRFAADPSAQELLGKERALDDLIRRATHSARMQVSDAAVSRVMSGLRVVSLPAQKRSFWSGWWRPSEAEPSIA